MLKAADGSTFPLVLAGGNGWLMEHFGAALEGLQPGEDVFLTGYASELELQWLMQNCFALVYPSHFEGFGMPVLEALSLGAPVLCSNTTSLPEAGGEAAVYFDPFDTTNMLAAMKRVSRGDVSRERMRIAGFEHAKRFSWGSSAALVRDTYAAVVTSPPVRKRAATAGR